MTAQVALITGAGGGLGRAVAAHLAESGWRLALVSRSAARLEGVGPADALRIEADVATPDGARAAVAQCTAALEVPSALVNCAGGTLITPLHRTSESAYRACLGANMDTAFFSLASFVEALRSAQRPGAAVLVSSVVGHIGVANHEAISMAKAAVAGLVRAAAAPTRRAASVSARSRPLSCTPPPPRRSLPVLPGAKVWPSNTLSVASATSTKSRRPSRG
jgi:NAD(P)-dependent dehydrogenase (short-subunit alcohol dehydrogenase family)